MEIRPCHVHITTIVVGDPARPRRLVQLVKSAVPPDALTSPLPRVRHRTRVDAIRRMVLVLAYLCLAGALYFWWQVLQ